MFVAVLLFSIDILLGLSGLLLIFNGLRGRIVGATPYCRRCRYDLRGRIDGQSTCPECGQDLNETHAIQLGVRHRRRSPLTTGLILLAIWLGISLYFRAGIYLQINWLPYEPFSWVLAQAGGTNQPYPALQELHRRVLANRLSDRQIPAVATAAVNAIKNPFCSGLWYEVLEQLHARGRLPQADWDLYLDQAVKLSLTCSAASDSWKPPGLGVDLALQANGTQLKIHGRWKISSLLLNGHRAADPSISGDFDLDSTGSSDGSSAGALKAPFVEGAYHVDVVIDVDETIAPIGVIGVPAVNQHPEQRHFQLAKSANFSIKYPKILPDQTIQDNQAAMDAGLTATVIGSPGHPRHLSLRSQNLPYPVRGDLYLVEKDRTPLTGYSEMFTAPAGINQVYSARIPGDCLDDFNVIIIPDFTGQPKTGSKPFWPRAITIPKIQTRKPATKP